MYEKLNQKIDKLQRKLNATVRKTERQPQTAYPRTINLTIIHFTPEEHNLLNLGLQYSLQKPTDSSWKNLIIETERAIRLLDDKLLDPSAQ
jgi:hypothetical protein